MVPGNILREEALHCVMCNGPGAPGFRTKNTPFQTRSIKELFWGYEDDPLLAWVAKNLELNMSTAFPSIVANYSSQEEALRSYNMNSMRTGSGDLAAVSQYVKWQNMSAIQACTDPPASPPYACPLYQHEWTRDEAVANGYSSVWGDERANRIIGTDGTQFSPGLDTDQVEVFIDALYRSVNLSSIVKSGEAGVRERATVKGIDMLR